MKLGKRIEAIRSQIHAAQKRAGIPDGLQLSKSSLARRLHLDRSAVVKWGQLGTSPRDIEATAAEMGVTVTELYAGKVNRARMSEVLAHVLVRGSATALTPSRTKRVAS